MADGSGPSGDDYLPDNQNPSPKRGFIQRLKSLFTNKDHEDALSSALQKGEGVAGLSQERRDMIERVIAFDDKEVSDVMIPRADIQAVEESTNLTELLKAFSAAGHSRLPVYRGDLDDPVGMVHIRDLVGILADPEQGEGAEKLLRRLTRKLIYVPPSMPITDLLLRMQASRIHMALVIDEFGGTDGLVTIEDLVEEIVGDIQDEHDDETEPSLKSLAPNLWLADARLELEDLQKVIGEDLNNDNDEIDTLGGLVFSIAGSVPIRGEVISHPSGYEFEIVEADARRIKKVKIRKLSANDLPAKSDDTDIPK
ncbi:MAG: hemolysin family protein [bacterium]